MKPETLVSIFFSSWACVISTISLIHTIKKDKKKNRSQKPCKSKKKR